MIRASGWGIAQFDDAMAYMSAATGQHCDGCHVRTPEGVWQMEKDDNDHKTTARTMLTMVQAINQTHFKDEQRVMCTTCHSGRSEPLATTPANLLANLPQLPMDVEYRIVGRHLLLRDVDANIIVDFIYNALSW